MWPSPSPSIASLLALSALAGCLDLGALSAGGAAADAAPDATSADARIVPPGCTGASELLGVIDADGFETLDESRWTIARSADDLEVIADGALRIRPVNIGDSGGVDSVAIYPFVATTIELDTLPLSFDPEGDDEDAVLAVSLILQAGDADASYDVGIARQGRSVVIERVMEEGFEELFRDDDVDPTRVLRWRVSHLDGATIWEAEDPVEGRRTLFIDDAVAPTQVQVRILGARAGETFLGPTEIAVDDFVVCDLSGLQ